MLPQLVTPEQERHRDKLSGAALRGFFGIAKAWGLTDAESRILLGNPSRTTFYRWKQNQEGSLSKDELERISYLLGIFKALNILFVSPEQADGWIRRPNAAPLFGGMTALDRMLAGNVADLFVVREYLDAQRGGWA